MEQEVHGLRYAVVIRALGLDIFVKDVGKGVPTLFLHGNPDSADIWDGVTERLQGDYRCIAPDLPGFGRSQFAPDLDCSLDGFARLVAEIVDGLGVTEPLNLVVHDFGGIIGLSWAVRNPDKVRRLAIMNTVYSSSFRWHFWGRIWRAPLVGELSLAMMNWPLFRWSVRKGSRNLTDEQIRETYRYVHRNMKRMVLKLYRATDPENFVDWEDKLLELTAAVPTLVLWGKYDPYISRKFAASFGTDNIKHFPDYGHWLPAEAPGELGDALIEHLA
jgi:pimeloyl-ACP methyl ester carboxylesterase